MPEPTHRDDGFHHCLVVGGAGMVGLELSRQLLARGKSVRVLDLLPVRTAGVESQVGDIRRMADVERACRGMDVVFQTAAAVWDPARPAHEFDDVNVTGNENVLTACRRAAIRRLVYTSTLDVVVDGTRPIVDGDESLPFPAELPRDPYSRSKILAEQLVLGANGDELRTCAVRPVGIYGPHDKYHLPNMVKLARSALPVRLGDGSARFSHVYVGNVAHAHLLAAIHLGPGSRAAGNAYFVTDPEPAENFFTFFDPLLRELGLRAPRLHLPYRLAYALAWAAETVYPRSIFSRFSVVQTCVDHTFVHHQATRDLGYQPIFTRAEAFARTLEHFRARAPVSLAPSLAALVS